MRTIVTALATQGGAGPGSGRWVTQFYVQYSDSGSDGSFTTYGDVADGIYESEYSRSRFMPTGITSSDAIIYTKFTTPLIARWVHLG